MVESLKNSVLHMICGADNQTVDLGRVSWILSTFSCLGFAIFNAHQEHHVDLMVFAQAVSIIVAAHGIAIFAKKDTEPKQDK